MRAACSLTAHARTCTVHNAHVYSKHAADLTDKAETFLQLSSGFTTLTKIWRYLQAHGGMAADSSVRSAERAKKAKVDEWEKMPWCKDELDHDGKCGGAAKEADIAKVETDPDNITPLTQKGQAEERAEGLKPPPEGLIPGAKQGSKWVTQPWCHNEHDADEQPDDVGADAVRARGRV